MPRYIDADLLKLGINKNDEIFCTPVRPLIIDLIDNMSTADVQEVKPGHWIDGNCGDYVCSVCGWAFSSELPYMAREYDAETEETMRYCMHCGSRLELQGGAEMGGGEQE